MRKSKQSTLPSDNLSRTYYKMHVSEKIKAINNKNKQSKAQYNLDGHMVRFLLDHQELLVNMNF